MLRPTFACRLCGGTETGRQTVLFFLRRSRSKTHVFCSLRGTQPASSRNALGEGSKPPGERRNLSVHRLLARGCRPQRRHRGKPRCLLFERILQELDPRQIPRYPGQTPQGGDGQRSVCCLRSSFLCGTRDRSKLRGSSTRSPDGEPCSQRPSFGLYPRTGELPSTGASRPPCRLEPPLPV